MKRAVTIIALLLVLAGGWARAQTNEIDVDGLMDAAEQFAQDNLDPAVLEALQDVDRDKVRDFLSQYQQYLQGDTVLDLSQLRAAAQIVLPLLDAHEETQPYAAWLRERLDYFDVTDQLKAAPPPPAVPNQPPPSVPSNPSFAAERKVWVKTVEHRPLPKGAADMVPKLKAIFAAEGVPVALVWVAEVESGFDVDARSPAGATGLFQLMPATAKQYGLSLWPWDDRKKPEAAARAAAMQLRNLYKQFGDWRLAVAAYNCGQGTVAKALAKHHAKTFAEIAPHLPAETQLYVPKVEAIILDRERLELEQLNAPKAVRTGESESWERCPVTAPV